ncbi:MAG: MarC family protein [Candidatus Omnitrophica bacterium]|nr:MarC family protein [Candidatus Omnitrophota bacterium]MBI2496362.1 MarC family protein [Candidatus Omnitrophota bacterium]MBI3020553.1 MarC family protein [Candidatus Omnitrophota bacterium]MBI3083712.1 MarC family protein [Candidatus Omnitrophota bacterium]
MDQFWHAFVPLFVAFDGMGLLPLFWGLSQRLSHKERNRAVTEAVVTALVVAIVFLLISRAVFSLMGLRLADIMVAGGAILFVLSLRDLLLPEKPSKRRYESLGVVPLGVPLLAGPAVLTMVLLVRDRYGWPVTLAALIANMALVWGMLRSSEWLMRQLGRDGAQVVSKITSLILTAFGVMLIRQGVTAMLP